MILNRLKNFTDFLLNRVFEKKSIPVNYIESAFENTFLDVIYHFPNLSKEDVLNKIIRNENELALYLFRLGVELRKNNIENLKPQLHSILKEMCSMEIYFNNDIDIGFYIIHGVGTVIGSRNKIGKGFKIHQGCTIGHKTNGGGKGNSIGNNVTMYANSSIIGENIIGDNVIIGAHVLVTKDVPRNSVVIGSNRMEVKSI
jgi:serine O-acetyltransferase